MNILEEIFNRSPSGPLFHYTDQNGLLGIIKDKEIWASHTQYLNDRKEYIFAIELVKSVIENRTKKFATKADHKILESMKVEINGQESTNVCVCSFSEDPDSLSQWRAYGGSSGYSIGFKATFLKNIIGKNNFNLAPCLYNEADQIKLLEAVVDEAINRRKKYIITHDNLPIGGGFVARVHRYAPIIKDSSFKEEKEWRIITSPLMCTNTEFDYRTGKSMLIPFFKISLIDEDDNFDIENLIVGPNPNIDQACRSAKGFLMKNKIKCRKIIKSKVPFRDW